MRDRTTGELKGSAKLKPLAKFFAWDLGDLNTTHQLDAIIGVRALTPQHSYSEFARQLAVRNTDDKLVCRCRISEVTSANVTSIVQISVSPLRGYSEDADKICQWLTENRCTPATTDEFYKRITGFTDKQAYFNVKPVIRIRCETSAREAACSIINAMLSVAAQTEAGVVADIDSEFLHDYRICMRKIRSVLSLMKGVFVAEHSDSLKQAFREIACETNRLRDLDVYLLEQQDLIDMLPGTLAGGLEAMFNDCATQQQSLFDYVSRSKVGRGQKEVALAVVGLVAILNQRQHAARNKVQSLFAEFDSKPIRESMKLMFTQVLDCPPSIGHLSENIFSASDYILVPVIPTTLSEMTFKKLMSFFKDKGYSQQKLIPYLNMGQKRRNMHKTTTIRMREKYSQILPTEIPFSADIENMGANRAPILAYAANKPASKAYKALWQDFYSLKLNSG